VASVCYRCGRLSLGDGKTRTEECDGGSSETEGSVMLF
jgi:hypothetical protein